MTFQYADNTCKESLDTVFNKKRADDRKDWLAHYDKDSRIDHADTTISYKQFVDKELIHFSKYDNERSIPNLIDGLKTSQRKILYPALKRNLTTEIKVAQFGGYVSEHSGYHHGEMSLMKALRAWHRTSSVLTTSIYLFPTVNLEHAFKVVKMLLLRDILTYLSELTKKIYRPEDKPVLNYLDDDGTPVEPEFYVPIIPMILVNGAKGIGTGFSTDVLSYNPLVLMDTLIHKLDGHEDVSQYVNPLPYYQGFKGNVIQVEDSKYLIKGKYNPTGKADEIVVTELPIGTWTDNYKVFLEKLIESKKHVKEYIGYVNRYEC